MRDECLWPPYLYDSLESLGKEIGMNNVRKIVEEYNPKVPRCKQHHYTMLTLLHWANTTHREETADFIGRCFYR